MMGKPLIMVLIAIDPRHAFAPTPIRAHAPLHPRVVFPDQPIDFDVVANPEWAPCRFVLSG